MKNQVMQKSDKKPPKHKKKKIKCGMTDKSSTMNLQSDSVSQETLFTEEDVKVVTTTTDMVETPPTAGSGLDFSSSISISKAPTITAAQKQKIHIA
jgi:hypothetical protein